jgi:hypothetical protein
MKEQNQVLGHWVCPQGGQAKVYQTKKAGRHFYTRCDCCGLIQGTGEILQQRIWDEAEFIKGVGIVAPSNVSTTKTERVIEDEPSKPAEPVGDFDPTEVSEDKQAKVEPSQPKFGFMVPLAVFAAAAGVAWLTN